MEGGEELAATFNHRARRHRRRRRPHRPRRGARARPASRGARPRSARASPAPPRGTRRARGGPSRAAAAAARTSTAACVCACVAPKGARRCREGRGCVGQWQQHGAGARCNASTTWLRPHQWRRRLSATAPKGRNEEALTCRQRRGRSTTRQCRLQSKLYGLRRNREEVCRQRGGVSGAAQEGCKFMVRSPVGPRVQTAPHPASKRTAPPSRRPPSRR